RPRCRRHEQNTRPAGQFHPGRISLEADSQLAMTASARACRGLRPKGGLDMPTIDGQRVVADLKRLAEFGRYKTGVHRPTYSPVDVESRHWLAERLREAGLDTVIDGIGNVIGRNPSAGRRLLVGSHSETQPYGGWLDGSLGVIYGLELARAFAADPGCAELGIEVAAWADEEGHYGNFLGSRSFTDTLPEEEIDRIRGRDDGTPLREALRSAGFAERP